MCVLALHIQHLSDFQRDAEGGGICAISDEFQIPEIIHYILYHKNAYNYIKYNVPIKPHKSCRQYRPPFSKYAVDNLGVWTRGGQRDHQNDQFVGSEFLCTCYLHIF